MVAYDRMVERRLTGEPLQYVVGSWSFRHLDLYPRSSRADPASRDRDRDRARAGRARSIGARTRWRETASSSTSAPVRARSRCRSPLERRGTQVWATDVSADALAVAQANCAGLGRVARHVTLVQGSWFDPLPESLRGDIDVIVSNPPYVAADDELPPEVREWEPLEALVPGPRGLEAYEAIVGEACGWLRRHGRVGARDRRLARLVGERDRCATTVSPRRLCTTIWSDVTGSWWRAGDRPDRRSVQHDDGGAAPWDGRRRPDRHGLRARGARR